jgi:hypothetical protein
VKASGLLCGLSATAGDPVTSVVVVVSPGSTLGVLTTVSPPIAARTPVETGPVVGCFAIVVVVVAFFATVVFFAVVVFLATVVFLAIVVVVTGSVVAVELETVELDAGEPERDGAPGGTGG